MKGMNIHTLHRSQKNLNFKKSEASGVRRQGSGKIYEYPRDSMPDP